MNRMWNVKRWKGTITLLPLPLRAWAAKRTKVGGRGRWQDRTEASHTSTPAPIPKGEGEKCLAPPHP